MLRPNLATRPFYNERLVHFVLAMIAGLVLAVTLLNLIQLVRLSQMNTTLSARTREDRAAADDYSRKARQTRQGIDQDQLKVVVAAAKEANALIDSRTFSWTEFLNRIEANLPDDVMLTSVRPAIVDGGTKITLVVLARRVPDIDEFIEKLEATGAFEHGYVRQQSPNDEGLIEAVAELMYVPQHAEPPAEKAVPPPAAKEASSGAKGASR